MTMTNAEWMIQNGYKFINLRAFDADNANRAYKICLRTEDYKWKWIGEVNKVYNDRSTAVFTWLDMEHKEQILDDAEKRYLSAVIRPFRDRVICICKTSYDVLCGGEYQRLSIVLHDCNYNTYLPTFKKGTMYKDMRLGHLYTLEDLGL